ncbi:hypothetical protein [Treponema sp. R80B11-R83G3]
MSTKKPAAKAASKKTATKKPTAKAKKSTTTTKRGGSRASPETSAKRAKNADATSALKAIKALTQLPPTKNKIGSSRALPETGARGANIRTQPNNPLLTEDEIIQILDSFGLVKEILKEAAANLRPLDRARLNGVGIKRQGFIERAFLFASENQEFLPRYLSIGQFQESFEYFVTLRTIFDACSQLREFIRNMVVEAADITFTDAGEFYKAVQEAARRRIDGAETLYRELSPFFKHNIRRTENGEEVETKKEALRDVKGLINGKKEGKFVIENIKPKLIGGKHKIIDETFKEKATFKETEDVEETE